MLTDAENAIVKAYVEADQVLNALPNNSDGAFVIVYALSVIANPAWIVWKSSVSRKEILQNGFDWTRLDNLSVGKARVWSDIFVDGSLNASKANVRAGIDSVWVGTTGDLAVRTAVYIHCKRSATILEKLLSTGTGTDAVPATMTVEGAISYSDVQSAMGW